MDVECNSNRLLFIRNNGKLRAEVKSIGKTVTCYGRRKKVVIYL